MRHLRFLAATALLTACTAASDPAPTTPVPPQPAVRIVLAGDVMTGRGMADLVATDGDAVFAGVRHLIAGANLAGFNLESPLTDRPHVGANENRLQGDPATAHVLAAAGFDFASLPNNHSTDSGPGGLLDTLMAVADAGMETVGGGRNAAEAYAPLALTIDAVTIAILAYDATAVGQTATNEPGIATWDRQVAVDAVKAVRGAVDVVIVSVHGGTEYLKVNDPGMTEIGVLLADAGADVVWGHGAHVTHPVQTVGDRPTVLATSLGNLLFDQAGPDRTTGHLLEVLVDRRGVVAFRVGVTIHPNRVVEFVEWLTPEGDAVWLHDSWWELVQPVTPAATTEVTPSEFRHGDLIAAAAGDITGDGGSDLVASFRRPHRMTPFMETHPEVQWADAQGRSAHLGVYEPDTLDEMWVAGSVLLPIAAIEVCDGSLALVHNTLDDPAPVAAGAWQWNGFGFDTAPDIPGPGRPACVDVDGDGSTEPAILDR